MARKPVAEGLATPPALDTPRSGYSTSFTSSDSDRRSLPRPEALPRREQSSHVDEDAKHPPPGPRDGPATARGRASASTSSHVSTLRWGYALVVGSAIALVVGLWSILIGPMCEPTGVRVRLGARARVRPLPSRGRAHR